jgi:hypothetical protein
MLERHRTKKGCGRMILVIDQSVREVSKNMVKICLDIAKDKYIRENQNAIYAVKKGNQVHMKNETFVNKSNMYKNIEGHKKTGFTVYYTEKKEK